MNESTRGTDRCESDNKNQITETELSECDREELHHIGHIQGGRNSGHSLFFATRSGSVFATDTNVDHLAWIQPNKAGATATNTQREDGVSKTTILGSTLPECLPADLYEALLTVMRNMQDSLSQRAFHFYKYQDLSYALSLSAVKPDYSEMGLEIEELDPNETPDRFLLAATNLGHVMECYTDENTLKVTCDAVFQILGSYDRAMVYRFNDDLSGEVIHEIKKGHIDSSYIGMRFPSSDIPLSARTLYIKNRLRYIHGVDLDNVPIVCIDERKVDLSQCRMRAVAKPHVIYLRNMGVVCSMSLAIVVEGELWGLMVFHGYSQAFKPSLHQRIACETIIAMLSVRIEALMKKKESSRIVRLSEFMMNLDTEQSVIQNLHVWGEEMLDVLDADVVVGHMQDPREGEGSQIVLGDKSLTPPASFWQKMYQFENRELCVTSTRKEIERMGFSLSESPTSGFIYFRESRLHVLVGRKERSRDVVWGGNPDEPKLRIGGILNPRASFDQFMEKAKMESRAWTKQDVTVTTVLRDKLCAHAHNYMMHLLQHDIEESNQKYLNAIESAQDNYEFFAHLSHELRTPFHGVMGCLNILRASSDQMTKDEVTNTIDTAISSGTHMLNLLNDILDISKNKHLSHECAKDKLVYQNFAFESIDGMKTLAQSSDIRLDCIIAPKEGEDIIITDRTKIIQIVSNIVNNAIKFTGKGGIDLEFNLVNSVQDSIRLWEKSAFQHEGNVLMGNEGRIFNDVQSASKFFIEFPVEDDKKWLNILVKDSGCGIDPTQLAKMFSPYTQASIASNRTWQGTGLGLHICLSLCQLLDGFIAGSSTPNNGTTFHIAIPVGHCDCSDGQRSRDVSLDRYSDEGEIVMNGPIMIVDDNEVNIKILKRSLEMQCKKTEQNYLIVIARGGQEAIDLYKEYRPSLCIIDYHMPVVDGIAATKEIRKMENNSGLPPAHIICYTADATEKAAADIMNCGTDEIMTKPPPKGFIEGLVGRLQQV